MIANRGFVPVNLIQKLEPKLLSVRAADFPPALPVVGAAPQLGPARSSVLNAHLYCVEFLARCHGAILQSGLRQRNGPLVLAFAGGNG
jgi:hypothetical protein